MRKELYTCSRFISLLLMTLLTFQAQAENILHFSVIDSASNADYRIKIQANNGRKLHITKSTNEVIVLDRIFPIGEASHLIISISGKKMPIPFKKDVFLNTHLFTNSTKAPLKLKLMAFATKTSMARETAPHISF